MSDHPFLRFINLVNFDQKLHARETEKISVDHQITALRKQEQDCDHVISTQKDLILQLKKRVDEQELEMRVLDQREKDKKKQLENLADYKDYQGLKSEVESLQHLQVDQEQRVLDAWNALENAQNALQKKQNESEQQLVAIHTQMRELGDKRKSLDDECAALINQRAEMEKDVPEEWLEKYTLMRARVADPVVAIFHQSCSGCSQMITSQEMMRAQRGALVQCQKCFRLLYAPEIMEKHIA